MASGFDLTRSGVGFRFTTQDVDFGSLTNRVLNPERFADPLNLGASSGAGFVPLGLGDSSMFTSSGFTSVGTASSGGINPYLGALIGIGRDSTTAIINRGNANQMGTAQLPQGTFPGPELTQTGILQGTVSATTGLPLPRGTDISLGAFAPQGGWPTTKDGRPRRVRRDGRPWKRPSMNPTNPRALGRAMRRVQGFANIAKRTISFTKRVKMKSKRRT